MSKPLNAHKTTLMEWLTCLFKGHQMGDLYNYYDYSKGCVVEVGCIRCGKTLEDISSHAE